MPTEIAAATVGLLEQHIIADDVTLEPVAVKPMRLALGAEAVRRLVAAPSVERIPVEILGSRGFITWEDGDLGLPPMDAEELEARRVLSGLPRWGSEVTLATPIHETTLVDSAVSFAAGRDVETEGGFCGSSIGSFPAQENRIEHNVAVAVQTGILMAAVFMTAVGQRLGKPLHTPTPRDRFDKSLTARLANGSPRP